MNSNYQTQIRVAWCGQCVAIFEMWRGAPGGIWGWTCIFCWLGWMTWTSPPFPILGGRSRQQWLCLQWPCRQGRSAHTHMSLWWPSRSWKAHLDIGWLYNIETVDIKYLGTGILQCLQTFCCSERERRPLPAPRFVWSSRCISAKFTHLRFRMFSETHIWHQMVLQKWVQIE